MQSGTFFKCTNCVYNLNLAANMSVQVISWLCADIPTIQPSIFYNTFPEILSKNSSTGNTRSDHNLFFSLRSPFYFSTTYIIQKADTISYCQKLAIVYRSEHKGRAV